MARRRGPAIIAPTPAEASTFSAPAAVSDDGVTTSTPSEAIARPAGFIINPSTSESAPEWDPPCSIKGLSSGAAAGTLGYLFGFLPTALTSRNFRAAGTWHQAGWRSAQSWAIMSGLYTAITCIAQRMRQVDDGWNRAAGGCSTGLALGWPGGPRAAVGQCIGIGALSYFLDLEPKAAKAGTLPVAAAEAPRAACCGVSCGRRGDAASRPWTPAQRRGGGGGAGVLDIPPLQWLASLQGSSYFDAPAQSLTDALSRI